MHLQMNAYLKTYPSENTGASRSGVERPMARETSLEIRVIDNSDFSRIQSIQARSDPPSISCLGINGAGEARTAIDFSSTLLLVQASRPAGIGGGSPLCEAPLNLEPPTTTLSPSALLDSSSSKTSSKSRTREKPVGTCKVCGDVATGKYFGALVCVPCKTFFLRYNGEGFSFVCKNKKACDISVSTRIQCKYCRFQKCLAAGMTRKIRPPQVEPKEGKQLCVVCSDFGNGVHFGVVTCEGCKKFFRRGLVEHKSYVCKFNKCCPINPQTRNACRYCRYSRCKSLGMSREAIQMGRPSKASQKQGIARPAERQYDETEGVMEVDGSNDEESNSSQVLDLSIPQPSAAAAAAEAASDRFPEDSASAISLVIRKPETCSSSSSSETLSFAPMPSFGQTACLTTDEISDQSVPSHIMNQTHKMVLNNLRHQADGNQMNPEINQSPSKRVTMTDLVAIYGTTKASCSCYAHKPEYAFEGCRYEEERADRHITTCGGGGGTTELSSGDDVIAFNSGNVLFNNQLAFDAFDDLIIEHKMRVRMSISRNYWSSSVFPDENVHPADERHLQVINKIVPNYGEFVSASETINHNLTNSYKDWIDGKGLVNTHLVSDWIKASVIPAFTIVSVKYCKQIPGFKTFDMMDQVKIACLGQSPSRILAAVIHWFDPAMNDFKDFLSWRDRVPGNSDRFKRYLIGFANNVQLLNLDPVEAALLNALVIVATDYPDLIDYKVIESARTKIICTFRAYITVKYGASSDRLQKLFGIIPEIRKIGYLHHEMTNRKTMMAEEFGERLLKSFNL